MAVCFIFTASVLVFVDSFTFQCIYSVPVFIFGISSHAFAFISQQAFIQCWSTPGFVNFNEEASCNTYKASHPQIYKIERALSTRRWPLQSVHKPSILLGSSVVMYMYMLAQNGVNTRLWQARKRSFCRTCLHFYTFWYRYMTYKDTFDNLINCFAFYNCLFLTWVLISQIN